MSSRPLFSAGPGAFLKCKFKSFFWARAQKFDGGDNPVCISLDALYL